MHGTTDAAGFLPLLIALARQRGVSGYRGNGENLWPAVHARDLAALFRLALEKGPAGRNWHAVRDEGVPFRAVAEAVGRNLGLPVASIPADVLMLPGHFGFLANLVALDLPASNAITRQVLGWNPVQLSLIDGHYFAAAELAQRSRTSASFSGART
jgi:nucleoside-diphosphate-sugar epimerase